MAMVLGLSAIIGFTASYSTSGVSICPNVKACGAAVSLTGIDLSTPTYSSNSVSTPSIPTDSAKLAFPVGVQVVSVYAAILAGAALIVMELSKPHLWRKKRRLAR